MRTLARLSALLLLLGTALAAHPAHAQTADDLLKTGVELRRQGDDAGALAAFQRAYAATPTGHALAQQALAEQALGRWADAADHLRQALADTTDAWVAKNHAELTDSLATIEKHVGRLELLGGIPGATVRVNGRGAGTLPLPGPITVEAGTVALEVRLAGYYPVDRTVSVSPEALARETIALVAEAPAPLSPPAPTVAEAPVQKPGWVHTRAAVAFGVGTVGLVTAVVAEVIRAKDFSDFEDGATCGTGLPNYGGAGCRSSHDGAVLAQDFVVAGLAVAAVASGLGAYWIATGDREHEAVASTPRKLFCAAAPVPGSGGRVGCALRF